MRFDASSQIKSFNVGDLNSLWRPDYPLISERTPYNDDDLGVSVVSDGDAWPLAFIRYSDSAQQKSIAFQGDRFEVSWNFDEEGPCVYPGYDELKAVLLRRYCEFENAVQSDSEIELSVSAAECFYENRIVGHSASSLIVGLASGWDVHLDDDRDQSSDYVGYRVQTEAQDGGAACSTTVAVDSPRGASPTLAILTSRPQAPEEQLPLGDLMDRAHESLISTFVSSTPSAWHRDWGRIA